MKMQNPKKCTCRTINLAKEGYTAEERKCKLLVYEKKYPVETPWACGPPLELGLKETHPAAKRVRVCTAADIRTTCPPPTCTCPAAPTPMTMMQFWRKVFGFGLKSAIVAGLVWATCEAGVWSDAKTTECLYVDMKNFVNGTDYTCAEDGAPRVDRIMHAGRQKWNNLVTCAFKCTNDFIIKVKKPQEETECEKEPEKKK